MCLKRKVWQSSDQKAAFEDIDVSIYGSSISVQLACHPRNIEDIARQGKELSQNGICYCGIYFFAREKRVS